MVWWFAAVAGAADVVQGANLLGMGRVGAAASRDNAAITLNPGLLGLHERYDFHAHFRYGPDAGLQWAASAMDGRTSGAVALGLAYSGDRFSPPLTDRDIPAWWPSGEEIPNRKRNDDVTAGLAVPMLQRRVSLGFGGTLGWYNHDRQGSGQLWDLHAGIGVKPIEALTLGLSLRNWAPTVNEDRPTQLLAGIALSDPDSIALEVDIGQTFGWVPHPLTFAAGIDKRVAGADLRFGGAWVGPEDTGFVTAGLGYTDSGGGIEYGLSVPVTGDVTLAATVHQISVRFGAPAPIEEP